MTEGLNIPSAEVLRELRAWCDWLIDLPRKIRAKIEAHDDLRFGRQERIRRQKEIVELRELTKSVVNLFLTKGSLAEWIKELQRKGGAENANYIRESLVDISYGIAELKVAVGDFPGLGFLLSADAAQQIGRAQILFEHLATRSDEELLGAAMLVEIVERLETSMEDACALFERLDEARKLLDHTYGDYRDEDHGE